MFLFNVIMIYHHEDSDFLELLWCTQAEINVIQARRKAQQEEIRLSSIGWIPSGGEDDQAWHHSIHAPTSEVIEPENHSRLSPSSL